MEKRNLYSGEALRRMTTGAARSTAETPRTAFSGNNAACGSKWGLSGYPLAMVYAPLQNFTGIYEPQKALCRGTIFAELDLPLLSVGAKGGGAVRNG